MTVFYIYKKKRQRQTQRRHSETDIYKDKNTTHQTKTLLWKLRGMNGRKSRVVWRDALAYENTFFYIFWIVVQGYREFVQSNTSFWGRTKK